MPAAPEMTRDEMLSRIIEVMRVHAKATGELNRDEWHSRYPGYAEEALQLFDTDRALITAASNWKAASIVETVSSAPEATITHNPALPDETVPERIGRYRILRPLGQGGMGTVYEAEDPELRRHVAIKVPHFVGSAAQQTEARQRFLRESRAAASIQHDNVCPIYDVGEDDGRPFVVMAYIEGESLADRIESGRFDDVRDAVAISARVASALAAVHEKGIIHRDLKPGNILLRAKDAQPVLTDFGLARVENDHEHATVDGTILGTAAYMAPEQAGFDLGSVTPRSDVYSLGVVLFEMLTGQRPFEGTMLQLIHKVATQSAPRASQFRNGLDPALDALLAKALARQPQDRYASASAFQMALAGWLSSSVAEPRNVQPAQPRTPSVRPQKPLPRPARARSSRWLPMGGLTVVLLVVGIALAGVIIYLRPDGNQFADDDGIIQIKLPDVNATVFIDDEKQPALSNEPVVSLKLKPGKHRLSVRQGETEVFGKDFEVKAGETTEWSAVPERQESPFDALDAKKIPEAERFPWQPKELVAVFGSHAWQGLGAPFWRKTTNGEQLMAIARIGNKVRITDPVTAKEIATFDLKMPTGSYSLTYVSPDGKTVGMFATDDSNQTGGTWALWNLETKKRYPLITCKPNGAIARVAVSPDGKYAATVQYQLTTIWDAVSGKPVEEISTKMLSNPNSTWCGVAFLPDSKGLVWFRSNDDYTSSELVCYDLVKRKERNRLIPKETFLQSTSHDSITLPLAISPDGNTVGVTVLKRTVNANNAQKIDPYIWFWDVRSAQPREFPTVPGGGFGNFVVAPDWKQFYWAGTLYDSTTGAKMQTQPPELHAFVHAAFSPDGTKLAMKAWDQPLSPSGPIAVCETATGKLTQPLPNHMRLLALAPDNKTLALANATEPQVLTVLDGSTGKEAYQLEQPKQEFNAAAFSPDGKFLASKTVTGTRTGIVSYPYGGAIQVSKAETGEAITTLGPMKGVPVFSPDGKLLACGNEGAPVKLWEVGAWKERIYEQYTLDGDEAMFTPDGKSLVIYNTWWLGGGGTVKWYDPKTGIKTTEQKNFERQATPAFLANGKLLSVGGIASEVATSKEVFRVDPSFFTVAHPDGRSFFTFGFYQVFPLKQWSSDTGKKLKEWVLPFKVDRAAITSDGRYLLTSNANGTVYILRLTAAQK